MKSTIITFVVMALATATSAACTIHEAPPGGRLTIVPGFDYTPDDINRPGDYGTPGPTQPDGLPR